MPSIWLCGGLGWFCPAFGCSRSEVLSAWTPRKAGKSGRPRRRGQSQSPACSKQPSVSSLAASAATHSSKTPYCISPCPHCAKPSAAGNKKLSADASWTSRLAGRPRRRRAAPPRRPNKAPRAVSPAALGVWRLVAVLSYSPAFSHCATIPERVENIRPLPPEAGAGQFSSRGEFTSQIQALRISLHIPAACL
jgi:hypothetical protein